MSAAEDQAEFSGVADRLGLEGDDRDDFINSAMKRLGHIAKSIWEDAPAENGKGGDGSDFFSRRNQEKAGGNSREVRGGRQSGNGGQYANFRS